MSTSMIVLITLIAYKIILLCIGFWASKRVKTDKDFFLAGQAKASSGFGSCRAYLAAM